MACRISELVLDCADPERLAEFWSKVLGYVELGRE
ncbi:VOC family protein, partial [Streptomyces virginiae]